MRRLRVVWVAGFFICWAAIIGGRLFWLQIIEHQSYLERAARQQERTFEVAPRRGILYDRNLHELAMTVYAESVYAVPSAVGADKAADAALLAKVVHLDPEDRYTAAHSILARMQASRNFAWVARKLDPGVAAKVKALNLKGIYFQKEFKRYYPDQELAAQVLGYVGLDDTGLGGLEQNFDEDLHGTPGRMLTALDARRHVLGSQEREPLPGENLVLSIDANIQYMAEKALEADMERIHAEHGTIIVQDPHTGQILALAIRPTFNPNHFRHDDPQLLVDRAVSDVYEPGSTFKLVAYSAALNDHLITPDSRIPTLGGAINVAGRIVHDDRDAVLYESHYGNVLTASQALWQSSDVAAIELAERMGKDRYYQYIRSFGFGQRTGIELPGETRGLVKPPRRWNPTTIGSIPMGQEIGVTPIQLVTMASTIANGGVYLPPHILIESTNEMKGSPKLQPAAFHPGTELPNPLPEGAHRVISELTAAQMRKMMEGVVLYGTGTPAQLNGYSAAGKTGTAEKIDPLTHTYSKTKFVASFVGFAPVNNPVVTIAVVMDSPEHKFHFGTLASAPVFHALAQQILEYLGVPHDEELKTPEEMAKAQANPPVEEPQQNIDDMDSLFAEVNHLPADDPLRSQNTPGSNTDRPDSAVLEETKGDVTASDQPGSADSSATAPPTTPPPSSVVATPTPLAPQSVHTGAVTLSARQKVTVPSFIGESMRAVVEQAGAAGLGVQVLGSGLARQQVPAAGTQVPAGTDVVVSFNP
jgi:cell division protein FtsI (penicillin-binding protein 3)